MSGAVTIQGVPESVRDELAARAARAGRSLQEYIKGLLVEQVAKPSPEEWLAQVRGRVRDSGSSLPAAAILAARSADLP